MMNCQAESSVLNAIPLPLEYDSSNLLAGFLVDEEMTPISASPINAQVEVPMGSDPDYQGLVFAAQAGCQIAFNELFGIYSRRVYRTAFSITKNSEDSEDVVQDSFFRAFLAIGRFEGRSTFYSWLTRIAINSALMILRKRRSRPEFSLSTVEEGGEGVSLMDPEDSAPSPEETYCQRQQHFALIRAINKLSPNLREVAQARLVEECSVREIAAKFHITEAAAKSRLYRARIRLGALPSFVPAMGELATGVRPTSHVNR